MKIGITEYAPMDYKDDNGNWIGFDADFANLICKELGINAEFLVLSDWGQKYYELETGNIDAIWNGMTITEETLRNTSCSDPYAVNAQVVVMKADVIDDYTDQADLMDLKFAVESGSAGEAVLSDLGMEDVVVLQDQADALMEVEAGTADACVVDLTMAKAMTGEGTGYSDLAAGISLSSETYGIGFRKESDLTAEVNRLISQFKDDGTLQDLGEKYGLTIAE